MFWWLFFCRSLFCLYLSFHFQFKSICISFQSLIHLLVPSFFAFVRSVLFCAVFKCLLQQQAELFLSPIERCYAFFRFIHTVFQRPFNVLLRLLCMYVRFWSFCFEFRFSFALNVSLLIQLFLLVTVVCLPFLLLLSFIVRIYIMYRFYAAMLWSIVCTYERREKKKTVSSSHLSAWSFS